MKARIFFTILLAFLLLPQISGAAGFARVGAFGFVTEKLFTGARSSALGYADMAAASGPFGILLNPAAPLTGPTYQVGYEYSDYISDFRVNNWGASYQTSRFRFSLVRHEMKLEGLIRTAYNPEGTGEIFKIVDQAYSLGAAVDVLPGQPGDRPWSMILGASWRHYRSRIESTSTTSNHARDLNLGLTLSHHRTLDGGWVEISGAVMVQNALEGSILFDDRDSLLPSYFQTGLALTWALQPAHEPSPSLRLLLAFSRVGPLDSRGYQVPQCSRWGLEISCFELIDFRVGDSDHFLPLDNSTTWGLGLHTPGHWLGDFRLSASWSAMDFAPLEDSYQVWDLTVGADF